jgi:hypothetical protein
MMDKTEIDLVKAAMELRASNPQAWENFLKSIEARCLKVKDNCILSPADRLQFMQGAAREAMVFLKELADAPKAAEQMREQDRKINGHPQHRRS